LTFWQTGYIPARNRRNRPNGRACGSCGTQHDCVCRLSATHVLYG